jgi:hypothetical protein
MKRLVTFAALVGALAIPTSAGAVIVPQHGMAGVRLGQTTIKVRAVAGKPVRVVRGTNELGPFTEFRYRGFTVNFFAGNRVTAVSTRSRAQRTSGGIGVGSTEAELTAAIPAAKCTTASGFRSCTLGVFEPGKIVTDFSIRSGKVRSVLVGFVID